MILDLRHRKSKEELIEELAKDPEAKMILEELLKKEFTSKNNENSPPQETTDGKTDIAEPSGEDQTTPSSPSNLDKPATGWWMPIAEWLIDLPSDWLIDW